MHSLMPSHWEATARSSPTRGEKKKEEEGEKEKGKIETHNYKKHIKNVIIDIDYS